ncbi:unnamed protein product, partial [Nippostrongylus brasiliensis]|uniref:CCHC-type domain-containing protein n=1 Tax=Nippostrongylus brasiliensis TaxID=27835 RepID=A0A0N4Y9C0_NIPBR
MAWVESEEAVVAVSDTGVSDNTQPTQPEMITDRAQDDAVMQDELELEFRRLCGDDKERAEVLQEEMRCRESELQELRQRCREQDEELQRLRQRQAELSAISDNTKLYAAEGWLRQFGQREGLEPTAGGDTEYSSSWTRDEENRRSDHCREEGMSSYLKYIALPDVKPYSGTEKGYSFQTFVEAFELKYPVSSWADTELCALFRAKLVGKARSQYEALPRSERRGSYEVLKRALARECRAEERTNKVLALGQLRHLRKAESQSIAEFCVELERLTRQAYPELDEKALATERAHLLYEQLVHWKDSYYLMEALESEDDAYMKLKATAQRIERRDLTLRNVRAVPGVKSEQGQSARPPVRAKPPSIPGSMSKEGDGRTKGAPTAKEPLCFTCKKPGHRARDCPKRAVVTRVAREQEKGSLSARLLAAVCRSSNSRSVDESQSSQRQK